MSHSYWPTNQSVDMKWHGIGALSNDVGCSPAYGFRSSARVLACFEPPPPPDVSTGITHEEHPAFGEAGCLGLVHTVGMNQNERGISGNGIIVVLPVRRRGRGITPAPTQLACQSRQVSKPAVEWGNRGVVNGGRGPGRPAVAAGAGQIWPLVGGHNNGHGRAKERFRGNFAPQGAVKLGSSVRI